MQETPQLFCLFSCLISLSCHCCSRRGGAGKELACSPSQPQGDTEEQCLSMGHTPSSLATCTESLFTTTRVTWQSHAPNQLLWVGHNRQSEKGRPWSEAAATAPPPRGGRWTWGNAASIAPAKTPHLSPKVKEVLLTTHPHWVIQLCVLHPDAVHANLYFVCRAIFRWAIDEV